MLHISCPEYQRLSDRGYRYRGGTVGGSTVRHKWMTFLDIGDVERFDERSPIDFIYQGPQFDRFRNKSVINVQVDGDLVSRPVIDGVEAYVPVLTEQNVDHVIYYVKPLADPFTGSVLLDFTPVFYGCRCGYYKQGIQVRYHGVIRGSENSQGHFAVIDYDVNLVFKQNGGRRKAFEGTYTTGSVSGAVSQTLYSSSVPTLKEIADSFSDQLQGSYLTNDNIESMIGIAKSFFDETWKWVSAMVRELLASSSRRVTSPTGFWNHELVTRMPDLSNLKAVLLNYQDILTNFQLDDYELSRHARDVIDDYNDFSSNLIAYGSDLRKTGDTIREVTKLAKNIKSPKAWASMWLSGRYGDRLAVSDTVELVDSLRKSLMSRQMYTLARAKTAKSMTTQNGSVLDLQRTTTLIASNESYNGLMTAVNNLMRWDAWPSLENTWDLVPLSFVVDWALPVQDLLGQIDTAVQAPYIKPISGYYGEKKVLTFDLLAFGLAGDVKMKRYARLEHNACSDVRPFDASVDLPTFSVTHAGDAVALVLTARGHR